MKAGKEQPRDHAPDGRPLYRGTCAGAGYIIYWQQLDEVVADAEEGVTGWSAVINKRGWVVDYPALCCETFAEAEEACREYAQEEGEELSRGFTAAEKATLRANNNYLASVFAKA